MTESTTSEKGFIPVMLTPFTSTGAIDYKALSCLTDLYLQAGASGLFANCLSSEMFELSERERLQVINHVVKHVDGLVPVVATGTFGGAISNQAEFVRKVHDQGTKAVILITGLLANGSESDEEFNERVFQLLDQTESIPLGFYECPVPYKRVLSPQQVQQFVATGRVIYHKDTSLDIQQVTEKIRLANNPHFGLYDAYMGHAVDSLRAGAAGLSCIQGNYFPELIVWLCDNYNKDQLQNEVARVQQFLIANMDVMHNVYPIVSKYFMQLRGFDMELFTRRSVGTFTPEIAKQVETLFASYTQLQDELGLVDSLIG